MSNVDNVIEGRELDFLIYLSIELSNLILAFIEFNLIRLDYFIELEFELKLESY